MISCIYLNKDHCNSEAFDELIVKHCKRKVSKYGCKHIISSVSENMIKAYAIKAKLKGFKYYCLNNNVDQDILGLVVLFKDEKEIKENGFTEKTDD